MDQGRLANQQLGISQGTRPWRKDPQKPDNISIKMEDF